MLFPPDQTDYLYPTRIPYEESSVFSCVDLKQPDMTRYPMFARSVPLVCILEPGDVLFVPKQYWHFVECLDPALSVNVWLDQPDDDEDREHEAVVRILTAALMTAASSTVASNESGWVNPTETAGHHGSEAATDHAANMVCLAETLRLPPESVQGSTIDLVNAVSEPEVLAVILGVLKRRKTVS